MMIIDCDLQSNIDHIDNYFIVSTNYTNHFSRTVHVEPWIQLRRINDSTFLLCYHGGISPRRKLPLV